MSACYVLVWRKLFKELAHKVCRNWQIQRLLGREQAETQGRSEVAAPDLRQSGCNLLSLKASSWLSELRSGRQLCFTLNLLTDLDVNCTWQSSCTATFGLVPDNAIDPWTTWQVQGSDLRAAENPNITWLMIKSLESELRAAGSTFMDSTDRYSWLVEFLSAKSRGKENVLFWVNPCS